MDSSIKGIQLGIEVDKGVQKLRQIEEAPDHHL